VSAQLHAPQSKGPRPSSRERELWSIRPGCGRPPWRRVPPWSAGWPPQHPTRLPGRPRRRTVVSRGRAVCPPCRWQRGRGRRGRRPWLRSEPLAQGVPGTVWALRRRAWPRSWGAGTPAGESVEPRAWDARGEGSRRAGRGGGRGWAMRGNGGAPVTSRTCQTTESYFVESRRYLFVTQGQVALTLRHRRDSRPMAAVPSTSGGAAMGACCGEHQGGLGHRSPAPGRCARRTRPRWS
jgi:hypothetical protein